MDCQRVITDFWNSNTQPNQIRIPQREKKRQNKKRRSHSYVDPSQRVLTGDSNGQLHHTRSKVNLSDVLMEEWGDKSSYKMEGCIRFISRNNGGLRLKVGNDKELELKDWMNSSCIDCIGIQETNINWTLWGDREKISERMKYAGFQFVRTTPSHNKHAGKRKYLHGGTAVVYHDQLTHQVLATGADDRSLGRWSWMTLGGGNTGKVHVISAYQPC